ncbi:MAG: hypothetical protein QNI84_11475 [Henriciella sp.]|nr:hypothetical protein [Henriciella sp.]
MEESSTFHRLVDRIYAAAIEPERYTELVDAWLQQTRELNDAATLNSALQAHFHRAADLVVDSRPGQSAAGHDRLQDLLVDGVTAELIVSAEGIVETANETARTAYGVLPGDHIEVLPIDARSADQLIRSISDVAAADGEHLVRLIRTRDEGPLIAALSAFSGRDGEPFILMRCNDLSWTEDLDKVVAEAFELTAAELDIFKFAIDKMDVAEIAEARDSALTTVRSQMRAIYEKTGTHGQVELVRLAIGLAASQSSSGRDDQAIADHLPTGSRARVEAPYFPQQDQRSTFILPSGRPLDVAHYGAASGRRVLLIHEDMLNDAITPDAQAAFERAGLRLASCHRPGFGKSAPYPNGADLANQFADDLTNWLDEIASDERVVILARGAGLFYATKLAQRRPGAIAGIVGVSPGLPHAPGTHFESLPHMCRFVFSASLGTPIGIGFATRVMIGYFNVIGVRRFTRVRFGNSEHDMSLLDDPTVYRVVTSSVETMTAQGNRGFAAEFAALSHDWTGDILACPVPIRLIIGESDRESRWKRLRRLQAVAPSIEVETIDGVGGLLFYTRYDLIIDAIVRMFDS